MEKGMKGLRTLISGLAGALGLELGQRLLRRFTDQAPRINVNGARTLEGVFEKLGIEPPAGNALYNTAVAGGLLTNSLYFSQVGSRGGRGSLIKGVNLGVMAGMGAVVLPDKVGLDGEPTSRNLKTTLMTVGLYTFGGLCAGLAAQVFTRKAGS
jgi:hypothetical protein